VQQGRIFAGFSPGTGSGKRRDTRRRLGTACAVSTLLVMAVLSIIPYPDFSGFRRLNPDAIDVSVLQPEDTIARQREAEPEPAAEAETSVRPEAIEPEQAAGIDTAGDDEQASEPLPEPPPDTSPNWYALLDAVASNSDALVDKPASMFPELDEKRRVAAARFSKPDLRLLKPIWENTSKDQLGRTILQSGDCWRVIDDPNVGSQWEFENFTQYIVYCAYVRHPPQQLPWVADIVARYEHLQPFHDVDKVPQVAD
jgi:hypothetical protein